MKSYLYTKNIFNRQLLARMLPFNMNKGSQNLETAQHTNKKFIWLPRGGIFDQIKISEDSYETKPMDLSNFLVLRTKEKMVLEAKLKDPALVLKDTEKHDKFELMKEVDNIRKEMDKAFVSLDRMLTIAREKEERYDFPVAFITNILYVCEKNGLTSNLIPDHTMFLQIMEKKQDYMHLEGISHAAYALNGIKQREDETKQIDESVTKAWLALQNQLTSRKIDSFQLEFVKNENYDPTQFDYVGSKAGLANRYDEYAGQSRYTEQVQKLFFEDQYALMELQKSFIEAKDKVPELDWNESLELINSQMTELDSNDDHAQVYAKISEIYQEQVEQSKLPKVQHEFKVPEQPVEQLEEKVEEKNIK